ncbi:MAG: DUF255 domain-containing protein [Deltaproteobacteria bacterium]|nr:DUF255 domain-containing protein [Deltaproteobacteria bacterium]
MPRPASVALLATLTFGACAGQSDEATTTSPPVSEAAATATITWHDWTPAPFEQARRDGKMVLIDIGMEGCTACRWMDELTYTHPAVIERIGKHFVAVQVDGEARPDIGERYSAWAWPATIIMNPEGEQVLAIRGNKIPKNFIPILDQLIEAHRSGTLAVDGSAPATVPPNPEPAALGIRRKRVVARIDRAYDERADGWGGKQKTPLGPHLAHALLRAHARGNPLWQRRALQTLHRYAGLIDPVWGGVFVAAIGNQWNRLIPEKRIAGQAAALSGFARAHRLTGDAQWLAHAHEVDRYVRAFLLSPKGGFYTSQEDDAPDLPQDMDAARYFAELDDAGRRRYGVPPIDHAIYTDKNALAIAAYVDLFEATEDQAHLTIAVRAATVMLARQGEDGLFAQHDAEQALTDDRMRPLPGGTRHYLQPQGPMGLALLDLYRVTAEPMWLDAAQRLSTGLLALEDPEHGGWFATDDATNAELIGRRKPPESNAAAARFVFELGVYNKDQTLRERAERGLGAISAPEALDPEGKLLGETALAYEWMTTGAVEISVLGDPRDPRTQALRAAAGRTYEPRKVLHSEVAGRYPDAGRPVVYVCSDEACSRPIDDPATIPAEIVKFAANRAP